MKKYVIKPLEVLTFDEFEDLVRINTPKPHWHYKLGNAVFTRENDDTWLMHEDRYEARFVRDKVLVFNGLKWTLEPAEYFYRTHEPIPESLETVMTRGDVESPVFRTPEMIIQSLNGLELLALLDYFEKKSRR
jgi:hypothetical protein